MATATPGHGWQLSGTSSDAYERFLVSAIFGPWARQLVATADLRPGERVLDVACGTGAVARAAVERVKPQGTVTAVDVNPGMLDTARHTHGSAPAIDWQEADALALPFSDRSFDVVLCQQGLQFLGDRDAAVGEVRRVLAPAGRLVVSVWRGLAENRAFALLAEALERHSPAAAEVMRAPFGFGGREALRELLARGGFEQTRICVRAMVCRFPSPTRLLRHQMVSSPLVGPLGELSPAAMNALVADVQATLDPYVDDDGLAVTMECHVALALADDR